MGLPLRSWFLVPIGVALFALTLTIGFVAKSFGTFSPDLAVDVEISETRNTFLNGVGLGINAVLSPVGAIIILALICAWLLLVRRAPVRSLAFGSITAVGWLSAEIGKLAVSRSRPPTDTVHALLTITGHTSFPSGHTGYAASLAWAAILVLAHPGLQRRLTIPAGVLFTVAVGLSRVYIGVHYPTDVLGSVLITTAGILIWLAFWNNLIEPALLSARLPGRLAAAPN